MNLHLYIEADWNDLDTSAYLSKISEKDLEWMEPYLEYLSENDGIRELKELSMEWEYDVIPEEEILERYRKIVPNPQLEFEHFHTLFEEYIPWGYEDAIVHSIYSIKVVDLVKDFK